MTITAWVLCEIEPEDVIDAVSTLRSPIARHWKDNRVAFLGYYLLLRKQHLYFFSPKPQVNIFNKLWIVIIAWVKGSSGMMGLLNRIAMIVFFVGNRTEAPW